MQLPVNFQEINLELGHIRLRAVERRGKGPRILAIHGWLDNAASFFPLLEALDCNAVAIDLPGCGHSQWLPKAQRYYMADMALIIQQAAQALGWDRFSLMGHSLGGALALMVAVTQDSAVERLIMIDSSGPLSAEVNDFIERFRKAQNQPQERGRLRRIYSSVDDAVKTRLGAGKMNAASAELIVRRSLESTDNGWHWSSDPRWRLLSPTYFDEAQVMALLGAVRCPTLWLVASNGMLRKSKKTESRAECVNDLTSVELRGEHHLHLDDPLACATTIKHWLDQL